MTGDHCTVMPPVSRGTAGPARLQTDLEENAGNFAREVKPLMRHVKHNCSDVCPNVPATTD